MLKYCVCLVALHLYYLAAFSQSAKPTLRPDDLFRAKTIGSAVVSPDGKWVVYSVSKLDSVKDKKNTDLWMVSWDGKESIQLTSSPDAETDPQFSPDGKYISFISSREDDKAQVWLLDRRGGEALKLTDEKKELSEYGWSPDSKRLVLVMKDSLDTTVYNKRKPYVISRYKFKEDMVGYLYDTRKSHLYLFNLATKKTEPLTTGNYDESSPEWSPLGDKIAFESNRTEDPDRNRNKDIWVIDVNTHGTPQQLTTWGGTDEGPKWSPDGKRIAYLRTASDANSEYYEQSVLCVVNANGSEPKLLSQSLDRPVSGHRWSKDGINIGVIVSDDVREYFGMYDVQKGTLKTFAGGERAFERIESQGSGSWLALISEPSVPGELYAVNNGALRKLTDVQKELLDSVSFAHAEKFVSTSKDGTRISGLIYYPPGAERKNLPLIMFIHGGPVAQEDFGFDMTRQMIAGHGYAVASVNYRGSSGKGLAFSHVITGDWGNLEVMDILGAADYLVEKGIADPKRMGIAGWSYGGILTDYTIASDTRFSAASSGAGVAAPLSLYGVDMYTMQYDNEIGQPWKKNSIDRYIKLSYPLLHADRIKTPTQFIGGEKDFNVPIAGSEQMYQALRSLNIPTELIVYPGQFHGITQPSFIKDRLERYFAWFDKWMGKR